MNSASIKHNRLDRMKLLKRFLTIVVVAIASLGASGTSLKSSMYEEPYLLGQWISELLVLPVPGDPTITKWREGILVELRLDDGPEIDLVTFDQVFFENLVLEIEHELSAATDLPVNFDVVLSSENEPPKENSSVIVYLSTRDRFQAISDELIAMGAPQSEEFIEMLIRSTGNGPATWNKLCFMSYVSDEAGYFEKSYAMVEIEVPGSDSIYCFSQLVLASMGLGIVRDPVAPSIMAPHTNEIKPTQFDYEALTALYDKRLKPGLVSENAETFNKVIWDFVDAHAQ